VKFLGAGTIIGAYILALGIFYLYPSLGPFYTCPDHFAHFPNALSTYEIQQTAMEKAKLLSTSYRYFNTIGTDYFIAFLCMHIAQPLVVLWFLRKWKRIAGVLIIYDVLLIPAILLLEWHYFADLLGGAVVAIAAIGLLDIRGRDLPVTPAPIASSVQVPELQAIGE
jgi:PAP2 superfamily